MSGIRIFFRCLGAWARIPHTRNAVPSLRGLVEWEGGVRVVHPWTTVYPLLYGAWALCDEEGNRSIDDAGRPIRLNVGLWGSLVARAAQRRWFRNRLEQGSFRFSETYGDSRRMDRVVIAYAILAGLCFSGIICWLFAATLAGNRWATLPIRGRIAAYAAILLAFCLPVLLITFGAWLVVVGRRCTYVRRATYSENGVSFEAFDGESNQRPWAEMYRVDLLGNACFLDGTRLRLRPVSKPWQRQEHALFQAWNELRVDRATRDRARQRLMRWAMGAAAGIGMAGGAGLSALAPPHAPVSGHPLATGLLFGSMSLASGWFHVAHKFGFSDAISRRIARLYASCERRGRRKQRTNFRL